MKFAPGFVVAVDGPAGAGKSTVCREVARRLGLVYIDTGALYRSVALAAREAGIPYVDAERVAALMDTVPLDVRPAEGAGAAFRVFLDGRDVSETIREPDISNGASTVSAHPAVRAKLLPLQRRLAAARPAILDGRDIGTVVFPDAAVKVFLTAAPPERARRRQRDLEAKGVHTDLNAVLNDIAKRDKQDSERVTAPLAAAGDAVTLDTTDLDFDQVVERIVGVIEKKERNQARP